uniref:N/A n=1 Tax=Ganoderma boninense TaxID=34458 RepID=A0A5K1K5U0_9APHY|nr:N/A [Ganoderma boninense]
MPPSESRSGTVTRTSLPPRNDPRLSSSGNATLRTGTPHRDAPVQINTGVLRTGSPGQRSAEPRTPHVSVPGPDSSASEAPSDWANPAFVEEKVTNLQRHVGTMSGLLQQVSEKSKENDTFVNVSDLAAQIKADISEKFAALQEQMKADRIDNRKAVRKDIDDMKAAIKEKLTESLGSISVDITQLNGSVDEMRKDIRALKSSDDPASSGVAADVEVSLMHVQEQLGPIPRKHVTDSVQDALNIIAASPINEASQSDELPHATVFPTVDQDVPVTPTAPDTPFTPSFTQEEARYFLQAMENLVMLYQSATSRTTV